MLLLTGRTMPEPLAYFLTWTTYGTWLPGDARGWVDKHQAGYQAPDPRKEAAARAILSEPVVWLSVQDRQAVDGAMRETCGFRNWQVHALNVRSNHVHIVVTAPGQTPGWTMKTLKSYGTRVLNRLHPSAGRRHWWTEDGSKRYLNDERSVYAAVRYVFEQDEKGG